MEKLNDAADQIPFGMVIVSSFKTIRNSSTGNYSIIADSPALCPLCNGRLAYRDSRRRGVMDLFGSVTVYLLRRLRCMVCKKLHTEIPDVIQPYKRYDSATIQRAIDGGPGLSPCVADDSTIRRWKSSFRESAPDMAQRLASLYARETDGSVPAGAAPRILSGVMSGNDRWLPFVMALLINGGHKLYTRFAFCPPRSHDKVEAKQKKGAMRIDKTIKDG
jgi:hypothetical protein